MMFEVPQGWVQKSAKVLSIMLFLSTHAACSILADDRGFTDRTVVQEAQARWDALLSGRVEEAYRYLSSGSQQQYSLDRYRRSMPQGFWVGAKVLSAQCEQLRCRVLVDVGYVTDFGGRKIKGARQLEEVWLKDGDEWRFFYQP